jgi:hypothetical protein
MDPTPSDFGGLFAETEALHARAPSRMGINPLFAPLHLRVFALKTPAVIQP